MVDSARDQVENDPELKALADLTESMKKAALADTKAWSTLWDDGLNYVLNKQLEDKDRKEGWPPVQMNMIYPAVKQEMAMMAQRRQKVTPLPVEGDDQEAVNFWQGLIDYRYTKTLKMHGKIMEASLDAKLDGWYLGYTYWDDRAYWDKEEQVWVGSPKLDVICGRSFGMDPNADKLEDAAYCVFEREIPVELAERTWPAKKAEIRMAAGETHPSAEGTTTAPAKMLDGANEKGSTVDPDSTGQLVDLLINRRKRCTAIPQLDGMMGEEGDYQGQTVVVTQIYFKDFTEVDGEKREKYTEEELIEVGAIELAAEGDYLVADAEHELFEKVSRKPETGEPLGLDIWPEKSEKIKVPKYPRGRFVLKLNNLILNPEQDDQVWERERWPFRIGVNAMLPHAPYGMTGAEMPRGVQDWANISATKMLAHMMYLGDAVDYVEEGAMVKGQEGKLRAIAGRIMMLVKGRMGSVQREPAAQMSPAFIQIFQMMMRQAQDLAGMHDQAIGAQTKGQPTATELTILQQSTQIGVGLQMILMDEWVRGIMEDVAELDQMNLEPGQALRIVGEKNAAQIAQVTATAKTLKFDIKLTVGPSLPFEKEKRRQELVELKGQFPANPKVDEMVLEAYEIENVEEVMASGAEYAEFLAWKEQMIAAQEAQAKEEQSAGGAAPALPAPAAQEVA